METYESRPLAEKFANYQAVRSFNQSPPVLLKITFQPDKIEGKPLSVLDLAHSRDFPKWREVVWDVRKDHERRDEDDWDLVIGPLATDIEGQIPIMELREPRYITRDHVFKFDDGSGLHTPLQYSFRPKMLQRWKELERTMKVELVTLD